MNREGLSSWPRRISPTCREVPGASQYRQWRRRSGCESTIRAMISTTTSSRSAPPCGRASWKRNSRRMHDEGRSVTDAARLASVKHWLLRELPTRHAGACAGASWSRAFAGRHACLLDGAGAGLCVIVVALLRRLETGAERMRLIVTRRCTGSPSWRDVADVPSRGARCRQRQRPPASPADLLALGTLWPVCTRRLADLRVGIFLALSVPAWRGSRIRPCCCWSARCW